MSTLSGKYQLEIEVPDKHLLMLLQEAFAEGQDSTLINGVVKLLANEIPLWEDNINESALRKLQKNLIKSLDRYYND